MSDDYSASNNKGKWVVFHRSKIAGGGAADDVSWGYSSFEQLGDVTSASSRLRGALPISDIGSVFCAIAWLAPQKGTLAEMIFEMDAAGQAAGARHVAAVSCRARKLA
jgi:hypothetical protein